MPTHEPFADETAEQIILSECLLHESLEPLGDLAAEEFFSLTHRKIAQGLRELAAQARPLTEVELYRWGQERSMALDALAIAGVTLPELKVKNGELPRLRQLVREFVSKRAGFREAADIAQKLKSEGTLEELRAGAQRILEKTAPAPTPAAKRAVEVYPKVPEAAWLGVTRLYREAVRDSTMASENYHLAAFLTLTGALLGRSIYSQLGSEQIFPNLNTVLVGMAGKAKKDTANKIALKLARSVDPDLAFTRSVDSRESFIRELAAFQKELRDRNNLQSLRCLLFLPELRQLIEKAQQKSTGSVIPMLCDFYDCPPFVQIKSGIPARVDDPFLGVVSGTSPRFFKKLSLDDLEGGIGSRFIFIGGDPKPFIEDPTPPNPDILEMLRKHLRRVLDFWMPRTPTRLRWLPEARELRHTWGEKWDANLPDDELVSILAERDVTTLHKVASIHAALNLQEEIQTDHTTAAIAFVEFIQACRTPIFEGHGVSVMGEIDRKIIAAVKRQGHSGLPYRALQQLCSRVADAELFHRRMKALAAPDSPLQVRFVGKRRWVYLSD